MKRRSNERTVKILIVLGMIFFILPGAVIALSYFYFAMDLPSTESLKNFHFFTPSVVYSDDGEVIAEFFSEKREVVPLTVFPLHLVQAFVAGEDARFFRHGGIDYTAILRALYRNLFSGEIIQGGSTITQQVVKSLLLTPERTFSRKAKEAILAYRIEKDLSKEEILFLYLNQIYLGMAESFNLETVMSEPLQELTTNPALGVAIFTLGGLAGAVFYLPFKKVKQWSWESYWLVYALAGLLVVPWVLTLCTAPNAVAALRSSPRELLGYCFLCGAMWGVGGLTWGLMIRYLGVGLGLAIGCGLCSATGTIIPPIISGKISTLYGSPAANLSLLGVAVSIVGIVLVGMAGMSKENELPEEAKKKAVAEYDFKKGILVAIFSGVMSAGMSFGLQGAPIVQIKAQYGSATRLVDAKTGESAPAELAGAKDLFYDKDAKAWIAPAAAEGERTTSKTWAGMPVLVVVLLGGLAVNALWCLLLNAKNRTFGDYTRSGAPLAGNLIFAALAGAIWCSQFICFKTGEPRMGSQAYVGWAVLMASAILFSTLLGLMLGEWKGVSNRTKSLLSAGLALLVVSAVVTGYANKVKQDEDQGAQARGYG